MGIYIFLTILLNLKIASTTIVDETAIFMIPENTPTTLSNYLKIMIGTWTWNVFLSIPSWGLDFLSYRIFFWAIALLLDMNVTKLLILEKIIVQFLAFAGAFLLSKNLLFRFSKKWSIILISSCIAGALYGFNPSFMIGDSFWLATQFSFALFPWIIWSFNKIVLDKNWKYSILCAFLMSLNVDEHFLWAGFPIILALYSGFIFVGKLSKEKRINFHLISGFFLVILIFTCMISYRLIVRFAVTSPYQLSLTKLGVDVCWTNASPHNMLRAMSHMDLPNMYTTTQPFFSFLSSLMPLTLLIPIFAFASLIWYKRNWVILFYGTLLVMSILPFFVGSPFKWLHYWLSFNTPFGPAFRTWRVPDAYIALSLSVLIAFSLYNILEKLSKRSRLAVFAIICTLLLFSIYSWPLLTGDVNGTLTPIKVPEEYLEMSSFLSNQVGESRVVYVPEFIYSSGKNADLKPFWSSDLGAIQEFLTYSSQKPTFWPIGQWGHFYDFTLSPLYYSLLRRGEVYALANFLSWVDVKYIVIHDDIPSIKVDVENCVNHLNNSSAFKLVFQSNFIYIFENQLTKKKVETSQTILVDGGYRAVNKFYNALNNSNLTFNFFFVDQNIQLDVLKKADIILTDKTEEQLINDLTFVSACGSSPSYIIYPYNYVTEYDSQNKWSRASYLDPHQQVWHPLVNWLDYAWDFDYMKGLIFTDNSSDVFEVPVSLQNSGKYVLLLRFFANEKGGRIQLNIENSTADVQTMSEYNGFLWYSLPVNLEKKEAYIRIKNVLGFNAISAIALVPEDWYIEEIEKSSEYLNSKQLINLYQNLVTNPSFEEGIVGWKMDANVQADKKFEITLDNSTAISGSISLRITTNYTKTSYGWSWLRSNWINVTSGDEYTLVIYMKVENTNSSHIVLEAYEQPNNRYFQLAQVPPAQYGTFDWRLYKYQFVVPEDVTKIRVDLNAGWSNKNGTPAITFFDNIKLIPLKPKQIASNLSIVDSITAKVQSCTKINPTLYKIKANTTTPFVISFSESYDTLWQAKVYKDERLMETVKPIPLFGIINGFWINQTGELDIVIEYEPQRWFFYGSIISLSTFLVCMAYVIYSYTKPKRLLHKLKQKLTSLLGSK